MFWDCWLSVSIFYPFCNCTMFYNILPSESTIFFFKINLFIYFWVCWVFVSVRGLSPVAASGGHSSSRCAGLFTVAASLVAEHRLQTRRLSSCGSRAQSLRGMWDPPRPGLEPVSPALAGRFSTTAPPGKPPWLIFEFPFLFVWSYQDQKAALFSFLRYLIKDLKVIRTVAIFHVNSNWETPLFFKKNLKYHLKE